MPRPRTRRLPLHLPAYLLVGALTTIAVSWACACWIPEPDRPKQRLEFPATWPGYTPKGWPDPSLAETEPFRTPRPSGAWICSRPGRARLRIVSSALGSAWIWDGHRFGFPAPAMQRVCVEVKDRFTSFTMPSSAVGIHGGLDRRTWRLAEPNGFLSGSNSNLPLVPIWPGFAIDTAAYAALAWLLALTARTLRARSRRHRGRCTACAYPLAGVTTPACPECGTPRPPATSPCH